MAEEGTTQTGTAETGTQTQAGATTTNAGGAQTQTAQTTDTTIAGGEQQTGQQQTQQTQTEQPDWRTRIAGEDKDFLKTLGRYTDEASFGKAHRALLAKMSSGEMKKALPEGATPEEIATWRKENGIPEKPEGYVEKIELPNGLVLGEADKPIVAEFAKAAHDSNVSPGAFSKLVAQYYAIQDQQKAAQDEADAVFKQQSEDTLRGEWQGAEFRQNLTAIQNMMAGWPEGLAARVLAGRSPEGRKLGDDPVFVRQLAALARELNPAATLVPAGTANPGKGVADRISEIKAWMGAPKSSPEHAKYWKDEKVQAEYRDLLAAQEKMKARAA